ncbi:MAG: PA2169 family four-helix-bundle protein [Anaerolineae bacterium]|nr:PA2169 family four-helix-bundle protein [Anaerolineae bacterium]
MVDRLLTSTLNTLIKRCLDAEKAYDKAIELVQNDQYRDTFYTLRDHRQGFASELQTLMSAIGETPADAGTAAMSVTISLNELQLPLSSDRDKFILEAIKSGIDESLKDYENALTQDLSTPVRGIVEKQYEIYKDDQQQVEKLLAQH